MSSKPESLKAIAGSTEHLVEVATRNRFNARRRKKSFLRSIPFLILLCLTFFILYLVIQVKYSKLLAEKICTQRDCIQSSMTLRDAMDFEQDPCEDFYAYACNNFPIVHPISEDNQHNSWFHEGEVQLTRMVQQLLMNVNKINDSSIVENTRQFFRSCIDLRTLEDKGLQPLYELLEKVGLPKYPTKESAETFNLGKTLGLIQRHIGLDILVHCSVARGAVRPDFPNDTFIIQVSPSVHMSVLAGIRSDPIELGLVPVLTHSKDLLLRIMFIGTVMETIALDLITNHGFNFEYNSTTFVTEAVKFITFTSNMKEIILANNTNGNDTEDDSAELMTFQELQDFLDDYTDSTNSYNKISWADFLQAFQGDDKGYWVYDYSVDKVSVVGIETFKEFVAFLGTSRALTVQRYIWWTVVHGYAKYTNKAMRQAYAHFIDTLYGIRGSTSRLRSCVALTRQKLQNTLAIPIRNHFKLGKDTDKISEMLRYIQSEFASLVKSLDWMDFKTKNSTIEKSNAIESHIGYEKIFLDEKLIKKHYAGLKFNPKEFFKNILKIQAWTVERVMKLFKQSNASASTDVNAVSNPLQVNAFYSRELNSICESLNYGAIGSILGHELTHGFDSEGKNYDLHGNWQEDLWSPQITQSYNERAQCFVNQYNNFDFKRNESLNGTYTLAENIADNGGLRESYYAYQSFVRRHGQEEKLPGFENYTHEQLFFLSFANMWCEGFSQAARQVLRKDPHSPNRVRVLASLQNMKEFSEAFNCPKGSFMNPENKCVLW